MFYRLRRSCFHPPSKLGGIQQAFFIKIPTKLKRSISGSPKLSEKIIQAKLILYIALIRAKYPKIFNTIPSVFISPSLNVLVGAYKVMFLNLSSDHIPIKWVRGYVVKLTQETNGGPQFWGYSIKLAQKVNKMLGRGI
jgi:hypothetical protein